MRELRTQALLSLTSSTLRQCQFGHSPPKLLFVLDAVFMSFYTKYKFSLLVKFQNFHNIHKPEFLHSGRQSHPNLLLQGPGQAK